MLLSSSVPYDPALWQQWWNAIMTTIGAASNIGMIIFMAFCVISVFKIVIRYWMH